MPVALAERRALRLAVVGEHDQVVGARGACVVARSRRASWRRGGEHGERVGLADAGVVGDLVVADERRIAHGDALDDVRHQQRRHQVAHHDRDHGADQRVGAAALDVLRAAAALAPGGAALFDDVGERQHERAHEAVGVGEVGEQVGRLGAAAVADDAHRRGAALRVA